MKFNRLFSSPDINIKPEIKFTKLLPRAKKADPIQRRPRLSQISKDSNLYTAKCNGRRHGYPSIETTGIPITSGPDEPCLKAPSYDEKKRRIHTEVPNSRKWSLVPQKIELEVQGRDMFNSFDLALNSDFNNNSLSRLRAPIGENEIFKNSLNLSLSAIKFEEDPDLKDLALGPQTSILGSPIGTNPSFGQFTDDDDDLDLEGFSIKRKLPNLDISKIQETNDDNLDVNTVDAMLLSGVALELNISKIQFEKEIIDRAEIDLEELLLLPQGFKMVDVSAIQCQDNKNDSREMKEIVFLLSPNFSLELELSMVQIENSIIDCSDIQGIEELLETEA